MLTLLYSFTIQNFIWIILFKSKSGLPDVTINEIKQRCQDGIILWITGSGKSPQKTATYKCGFEYHDLEEKIAHAQAYIEGTKKNRKAYLKKNGFATLEKYNEFVAETSKVARASKELDKKIRSEQTTFDAIYASLDTEKDVSQITLDPRDVADLKAGLKHEFSKDFSDADVEKADKQFCDYDNADPSTYRKLNKHKRDIEKENERNKELGISVERGKSYNYPEHDR